MPCEFILSAWGCYDIDGCQQLFWSSYDWWCCELILRLWSCGCRGIQEKWLQLQRMFKGHTRQSVLYMFTGISTVSVQRHLPNLCADWDSCLLFVYLYLLSKSTVWERGQMNKGEWCLLPVRRIVRSISIDSSSPSQLFLRVSVWTGAGHEGVTLMGPSATHGVYWENQCWWTWSIRGYGAREKGVIIASLFVIICEITEIPTWHMALASKAMSCFPQCLSSVWQPHG